MDQLAGRMRDAEAELVAARGAADEAHRRMSALAEEAEALR